MGGLLSTRQRNGVEEIDVITNHAYKYPPKSGNYFGTHFIMGGERFDTPQPESYLFGENSDLNFLGCRPIPFPYPPPQPNEPTKTLKCLVNIRKESLRFVRASSEYNKVSNTEDKTDDVEMGTNSSFNIEFTFDSDVKCAITIYYFSTEEITSNGVNFIPRDSQICSETFHYNRGADQQFCQPTHVFNPAKFMEDEFQFDIDKEIIPIAIYCVAEDGPEDMRQSHTTIATVDKIADGIFLLKALKQKLYVDGLCYLLQEIYGIENKNNEKITGDEETEDNGSECVICMCDVRDTLILPCRHLCLCFSCADSLRYQANNCPICRAPFRALLQIRALQKCSTPLSSLATAAGHLETICDNIPAGYEAVSLIEALNGPCQSTTTRHPPSAIPDLIESPENENAAQAARILNRQSTNFSQPSSPDFESKKIKSSSRSDCTDNPKEKNTYPLLKDEKETAMRLRNNSIKLNENDREENNDEDSEAEKLSPLLQKKRLSVPINVLSPISALCLDDDVIIDNIDESENINIENETCSRKKKRNKEGNFGLGDNSDYYTSSDAPAENFLYNEAETLENSSSSIESTPHKLPGTPLSIKSSGESYASGGSTKQLLAITKKTNSESVSVHV